MKQTIETLKCRRMNNTWVEVRCIFCNKLHSHSVGLLARLVLAQSECAHGWYKIQID